MNILKYLEPSNGDLFIAQFFD